MRLSRVRIGRCTRLNGPSPGIHLPVSRVEIQQVVDSFGHPWRLGSSSEVPVLLQANGTLYVGVTSDLVKRGWHIDVSKTPVFPATASIRGIQVRLDARRRGHDDQSQHSSVLPSAAQEPSQFKCVWMPACRGMEISRSRSIVVSATARELSKLKCVWLPAGASMTINESRSAVVAATARELS